MTRVIQFLDIKSILMNHFKMSIISYDVLTAADMMFKCDGEEAEFKTKESRGFFFFHFSASLIHHPKSAPAQEAAAIVCYTFVSQLLLSVSVKRLRQRSKSNQKLNPGFTPQ